MKLRNILFLLMGFASLSVAQPVPTTANNNANEFAEQAGVIAGTAQACGQDVSIMNARTAEVINVLTKNSTEQQQAMLVYEKILAGSQVNQSKNHTMKCPDVLKAYNSLPMLRDDYKTTVLPGMAKMGTP